MRHNVDSLELLYEAIPTGEDNAVSLETLAEYFGVSERDMRSRILFARKNGYIICSLPSEQKGYYIPVDDKELLRCYRMFKKRQEATDSILQLMRDCLVRGGIDPDRNEKEEGENHV